MKSINNSTREKLLQTAGRLFADRGFYGVSINDIAKELGLSKQGLLHHFSTKEKIYLAVLEEAVTYVLQLISPNIKSTESPAQQIIGFCESFSPTDKRLFCVSRLLVREILDNPKRAGTSHKWLLTPFLTHIESIILEGQRLGQFAPVHPLAFMYQIIGAQQYFIVSLPTLKQMSSAEAYQSHIDNHLIETRRIIEKTLFVVPNI